MKEDAIILNNIINQPNAQKLNVTQIANDLASQMNRSKESIRDRLKRYIKRLSIEEINAVLQEVKENPNQYIHFLKRKEGKGFRIEKFSSSEPKLQNREFLRQPVEKAPKIKKVPKIKKQNFEWITSKLQSSDDYFSISFGLSLLNAIFGELNG